MVVKSVPTRRQQLQFHPGLSLALQNGVTRDDMKMGRLAVAGCYFPKRTWPGTGRRHGYVLLPKGTKVHEGEIIEVAAKEGDGADGLYSRFYATYVRQVVAHERDYFYPKYSGADKEFRCGKISPAGRMRVEIYLLAKYWDYDRAAAEDYRNKQISDADLRAHRIVIGECSPGVDSWLIWKVRIPRPMHVKPGDYLEVRAGATEAPRAYGPLSVAIRRVVRPPQRDFIYTHGRNTVSCTAPATPVKDLQ